MEFDISFSQQQQQQVISINPLNVNFREFFFSMDKQELLTLDKQKIVWMKDARVTIALAKLLSGEKHQGA